MGWDAEFKFSIYSYCVLAYTQVTQIFRLLILTFLHICLHHWYLTVIESRDDTALPPWLQFFTKEHVVPFMKVLDDALKSFPIFAWSRSLKKKHAAKTVDHQLYCRLTSKRLGFVRHSKELSPYCDETNLYLVGYSKCRAWSELGC